MSEEQALLSAEGPHVQTTPEIYACWRKTNPTIKDVKSKLIPARPVASDESCDRFDALHQSGREIHHQVLGHLQIAGRNKRRKSADGHGHDVLE